MAFSQSMKKEGPLNPLGISPRFLVEVQVAGKGDPG